MKIATIVGEIEVGRRYDGMELCAISMIISKGEAILFFNSYIHEILLKLNQKSKIECSDFSINF